MKTIINPNKKDWGELAKRPVVKTKELEKIVNEIFREVAVKGDNAVKKYTSIFDKAWLSTLSVNEDEFKEANDKVPEKLKAAIQLAMENISKFHTAQKDNYKIVEINKGINCWLENRAIEKVGIYIPGGTASLFSTVLMLGIPAVLAGCKEIVLCSPCNNKGNVDPFVLYTASLVGITSVYKIGGIQAIAAMTFGTESIQKVDKIFGPGNQYVTAAKQMAQNYGIAIDLPAGPSEVMILADKSCNPSFVAADLLSQAEHGEDSQVVLLSDDEKFIDKSLQELKVQIEQTPRKEIAGKALKNSKAIYFTSFKKCMEFSNFYAPEHLIFAMENANKYIKEVTNAGSVFLGPYSCESAGDYASGTNHTLPTNGYARNYSGVSMDSFMKKISFQEISKEGLQSIGPAVELMAEAEQLIAHKNAVKIRLKNL